MARSESDREDLLREATALVERVELAMAGWDAPVVVGFRRDGCASVFFGADPVYQFNTAGQLRRAYIDGVLYKAEQGRLVALRRERGPDEVSLVRSELSPERTAEVLANLQAHIAQLQAALSQGSFTITGQVPAKGDVVSRVRTWLDTRGGSIAIAHVPNAR